MTDNNGIVVMEKPDSISFKEISDVLLKAHEQHRKNGIYMRVPHLPPAELEKWIGDEGKCFVALNGDTLVGTGSYMIRDLNRWYHKGKAIELTMEGILPEYQGRHIFTMIQKARDEIIKSSGYRVVYMDTAEKNTRRLLVAEKEGYIPVDFLFPSINSKGHYFVSMMKWLDGSPFSKEYCIFRFRIKRIRVKLLYTLFGNAIYKIRKHIKR